jgi:transcriptional regulator with XRE-family HTH domain
VAKRAVHPVLAQLGSRVHTIRKKKKISQKALAEQADMSTKRLGEIERGVSNARIMTAVKLADGLGVPTYALFVPDDLVPPSADPVLVRNFEVAREAFSRVGQSIGIVPKMPGEPAPEPRYDRPSRLRSRRQKS